MQGTWKEKFTKLDKYDRKGNRRKLQKRSHTLKDKKKYIMSDYIKKYNKIYLYYINSTNTKLKEIEIFNKKTKSPLKIDLKIKTINKGKCEKEIEKYQKIEYVNLYKAKKIKNCEIYIDVFNEQNEVIDKKYYCNNKLSKNTILVFKYNNNYYEYETYNYIPEYELKIIGKYTYDKKHPIFIEINKQKEIKKKPLINIKNVFIYNKKENIFINRNNKYKKYDFLTKSEKKQIIKSKRRKIKQKTTEYKKIISSKLKNI